MTIVKKRPFKLLGLLFFGLSIFIRYRMRGFYNLDMDIIIKWYEFLYEYGFRGLSDGSFANYPPAYLYLIWFSTLFSDWVGPLVSIKIIPTAFDLLSAFMVFKIAESKFQDDKPYFLAGSYFLLPTIMLNSTAWGQIDSLYTSFLLVCFYLLSQDRPLPALIAFGVAFSFKAQAIFFLPFLGILVLRKRIKWHYFFIIPIVYVLLAVPTVLAGRDWKSILFLYAGQVSQFEELAKAAPNLYLFIPNEFYHPILEVGLIIFAVCMAAWAWVNWKAGPKVTEHQFMLTVLASLALIPFLLPKMHDRYFYPADVFSFVTILFIPEMWFLPLLYQVMSGMTYTIFLFGFSPIFLFIAVFLNTALVVYIVLHQLRSLSIERP